MAEEHREPTLRFTVLSARDLKVSKFLGKTKCYALAWIDPRLKRSTKTTPPSKLLWNDSLSFPLSLEILQNPNACLIIQLLSTSPIHHERLIGSAILSISDIRYHQLDLTLQVWRPSGRAQGLLRVSAWIDCDLRISPVDGCVTGIPVEFSSVPPQLLVDRTDLAESGYSHVVPSAPVEMTNSMEEPSPDFEQTMSPSPVESEVSFDVPSEDRVENGYGDWKSLMIGFVGGAVAAAIVLARKR